MNLTTCPTCSRAVQVIPTPHGDTITTTHNRTPGVRCPYSGRAQPRTP